MSDNKLLNQIGDLIDKKLDPIKAGLKEVKPQLDTVELKVEAVNSQVNQLGGQLKQTEQRLEKAVAKSQEETIEVLSALMHTSYDMHEKRIRKIEDKLQITSPQQ